jgi:hypothetical protein
MLSIVAIPAEIITGVLSAFMMPLVPVSSVGNTNPNLLANPNFTSSVSVSGQGVWTWDGTVTHTADGSGSVSVSCDGTPKALLTDPVIAVSAGQTLACSMWLQWAGVAGAGECFALSIATYLGTNLVATTEIENVSNPAASATWLQLTGSYTIPSSGVDGCRLQLSILPAATAGTVHWDDGVVQKTQLMAESWTAGLPGDLNNLGTGVSANAANLTGSLSGITNFLGGLLNPISGANQTQANAAMQNIYSAVMQNAQALLGITSITKGQNNSGMSATVNFSGYPAGPLPSIFTVNYSGAGTSTIGVDAAGFAHWNAVADANRSAICVFNAETSMSDYQIVGQTLASYTQGGANYILARMSPDGANYVYAKFTATPTFFGLGLEYDVELGCIVAGTKTVWVTPTQVPSPNNNWLVAGTTASGRQFQVISGSQPVVTYLDSANTSQMGSGYRNSGFGGDVVVSGGAAYAPGDAAGWSVADNLPPSVVGSSFRQYRTLTTTVTLSATGYQLLPASFFTNVDYITNDLTLNVTTNALTISIEGTYFIHCRYKINTLAYQCDPAIYKNGVVLKRLGADFGTAAGFYGSAVDGACQAYLKAGDVLQAGAWVQVGSDAILQGEATGEECYWEVSLLNRSTA